MTENHLDLLQLKVGRIQGGEFLGAVWGSRREGGHVRRQPLSDDRLRVFTTRRKELRYLEGSLCIHVWITLYSKIAVSVLRTQ